MRKCVETIWRWYRFIPILDWIQTILTLIIQTWIPILKQVLSIHKNVDYKKRSVRSVLYKENKTIFFFVEIKYAKSGGQKINEVAFVFDSPDLATQIANPIVRRPGLVCFLYDMHT